MKCSRHNAEAVAVCAYCGRAVCEGCVQPSNSPRIVCSNDCATALAQADLALQTILRRSAQSARASAFYCYVSGGLSAAAAVVAWYMLPSPFLMLFAGGCAVVLIASGIWYGRGAKVRGPGGTDFAQP